ncbi:hypothetical protein HN51_021255 [Arachis hypogaea]
MDLVGVNEKFKIREKLTQLGFGVDEVVCSREKWPTQERQLRQGGDGGDADPEARKLEQQHDPRRLADAIVNRRRLADAPPSFGILHGAVGGGEERRS